MVSVAIKAALPELPLARTQNLTIKVPRLKPRSRGGVYVRLTFPCNRKRSRPQANSERAHKPYRRAPEIVFTPGRELHMDNLPIFTVIAVNIGVTGGAWTLMGWPLA